MDAITLTVYQGVAGADVKAVPHDPGGPDQVDPALLGRIMGKEEAEKYLATGGGA
jgi:hypothetical protein